MVQVHYNDDMPYDEPATNDELASVTEAAEILGCARQTVIRLIRDGELPARRVGPRVWVIRRGDLDGVVVRQYESKADFEARRAAARALAETDVAS